VEKHSPISDPEYGAWLNHRMSWKSKDSDLKTRIGFLQLETQRVWLWVQLCDQLMCSENESWRAGPKSVSGDWAMRL
jgi:hypothetical protein